MSDIKIHSKIEVLKDGYSMLNINPRLSVCYRALKKPGKNKRMDKIQCVYFGFDDEATAWKWLEAVRHKFNTQIVKAIVREGDRLTQCSYEVKVWEFDGLLNLVLHCAETLQEAKDESVAA